MKARLWFVKETEKARCYSRIPLEKHPTPGDLVWIPKSQIEHTMKMGSEHHMTVTDWFAEKEDL